MFLPIPDPAISAVPVADPSSLKTEDSPSTLKPEAEPSDMVIGGPPAADLEAEQPGPGDVEMPEESEPPRGERDFEVPEDDGPEDE